MTSGKTCTICNEILANPRFLICKRCNESNWFPPTLKIEDTFFKNGQLKVDVFLEKPERIAQLFSRGDMGMNKLRTFFVMLRAAYDTIFLGKISHFENIKPQLFILQRAVEDRTRRGIVPESFRQFINHHLKIVLNSETQEELYGFMEFYRSIIAYSK